jgi:hypothetical protein
MTETLCIVWSGTTPRHGIYAVVVADAHLYLHHLRWHSSIVNPTVYDSWGNTVHLSHDGRIYRRKV